MANNSKQLDKPQQITFDITDRCQMQCLTCSKWQTKASDVIEKELTTQEWKDIIFKLHEWLGDGFWFCLSGGEPFLRDDIFELADYAKYLNVHTATMSNAYSISQHLERIVDSSIESINISLNSINNQSIHDNSRGREESCKRAVDSILELNRLKNEKGSYLGINIATIILPDNIDELVPLVEFVTKNKINGIMFQLMDDNESFHSYNSQKGVDTFTYEMPIKLRRLYIGMAPKILPVIDRLIEMKKAGHSIYNSFEQLEALKLFFRNPENILKAIKCDVGSTNFAVDPYGDVRLCFNMQPVGSLKTHSPQEIWENAESVKCRNATKSCKMYCRMLNCNFKENFSNFNKNIFQRCRNKLVKIYRAIFSIN